MAWTGVITNKGAALLDQWALGGTLTITGAATGTGTVAEAALMAQTALVSQKQTASIVAKEMQSTGLKVKLQITAPQTGYTLQQYGVWAKLGAGDPILLALFQKVEGVVIPSAAETPDFVYTLYALLAVSNTGELEVTVDPSALVTYGTMEDYVEAATADMVSHMGRTDNPHQVTPAQLGLDKVLDGLETLGPARAVTIEDAEGGLPIKSCAVNIYPVQLQWGTGDPAPNNYRPILGHKFARITVARKNLWGGEQMLADIKRRVPAATVDGSTIFVPGPQASGKAYITSGFKPNTQYTLILKYANNTISGTYARPNLVFHYSDDTRVGLIADGFVAAGEPRTVAFHSDASKTLIRIEGSNLNGSATIWTEESGLFEGNLSVSDFEAFNGETIEYEFPDEAGTVYGGTLDVRTGVLTVDRRYYTFDGTENWQQYWSTPYRCFRLIKSGIQIRAVSPRASSYFPNANVISSTTDIGYYVYNANASDVFIQFRPNLEDIPDLASWKAWLAERSQAGAPLACYHTLAKPEVYQLTPKEVLSTIAGTNNIWCTAGNVTVEYGGFIRTLQGEIERLVSQRAKKNVLAGVEESSTATANYAVGDFLIVGDSLYKVTAAIASGETIAAGTNVQETTVAQQLKALFASV